MLFLILQLLLHNEPCTWPPQRNLEEVRKDIDTILHTFDKNRNGQLDADEVEELKRLYKEKAKLPTVVRATLEKYDVNHDGEIDDNEVGIIQQGGYWCGHHHEPWI
jgi:hypothetical protein